MIIGGVLFILGLCVGSFLNSFLWRYQEKKSFKGRSMCPFCEHKISWYDNIPIVSWFLLSGRCRNCKKAISIQYPIVEFLAGISFLLVGLFSKPAFVISSLVEKSFYLKEISTLISLGRNDIIINFILLFFILLISYFMILIAVYDIKTKEIPNGFNLSFVVLALCYSSLAAFQSGIFINNLLPYVASAGVAFIFFWAFVFFSKETWMGGGDAKFAIGMGLILGPAGTFLAIFLASLTGSIYGILAIIISKSKIKDPKFIQNSKTYPERKSNGSKIINLSSEIPFGPFLALGTFISLIFGPQIIDIYVKIFLGI